MPTNIAAFIIDGYCAVNGMPSKQLAAVRLLFNWLVTPASSSPGASSARRTLRQSSSKSQKTSPQYRGQCPEGTKEILFREAFRQRRCLVSVDSFYEWQRTASGKQPYAIALADRTLMALAGLWESWRSPAGERVRSFAIITTTPNELCAQLHNRMPVILAPDTWPAWLGEEPADEQRLKPLLAPCPSAD
jgi:putative SOS response-associated peptidase YedK